MHYCNYMKCEMTFNVEILLEVVKLSMLDYFWFTGNRKNKGIYISMQMHMCEKREQKV